MQNNQKITWKLYEVSITAPDGTLLKGEIKYWPKDYSIRMTEPYQIYGCGRHLLYGIPVVFVTTEPKRDKVHQIDLIERAEQTLLAIYQKHLLEEKS